MIRYVLTCIFASVMIGGAAHADDSTDIHNAVLGAYERISGPVGEERDWDAFRALFLPKAVFTVSVPGEDVDGAVLQMTVDEYVLGSSEFLKEIGFIESETHVKILQYGDLATVLSAYEGTRADTGEVLVVGVNTFILAKMDGVWKIASISWREADEEWPVERMFE